MMSLMKKKRKKMMKEKMAKIQAQSLGVKVQINRQI
jgi:hypothetical protein